MAIPPIEHFRRQAALQDAILKRMAEQSLSVFAREAFAVLEPGRPFLSNWHIDLICDYLEAVTAGQITRLVINLPPRYMKTLLVAVLWPAWEWIRFPHLRWIFASHAESLATKLSMDRRALIQSNYYRMRWGHIVRLASDQNVKDEFQNTKRGLMVAVSLNGAITGKGGDRIIVDDPHDPSRVESDAHREAALRFFTRTLATRLDSKQTGAIVVVAQRVHELDLSALCRDVGYTQLVLPAETEVRQTLVFPRSGRQVVREVGDVLWPQREPRQVLAQLRRVLGEAAYAGQYQQRPAPAGGTVFDVTCLKEYDIVLPWDEVIHSWDMSFKDSSDSDFVVGLVLARKGPNIYLVDRVKGQWGFTETCRQFERLASRYPTGTAKLVEGAANGHAIIDALSKGMSGILEVVPRDSKLARARAANVLVESGNVFVPAPSLQGTQNLSWVADFLHQLRVFPKGAHDDDVDAFTQGMAYFLARPWVAPASMLVNPDAEETLHFDALEAVLQRMRDKSTSGPGRLDAGYLRRRGRAGGRRA